MSITPDELAKKLFVLVLLGTALYAGAVFLFVL